MSKPWEQAWTGAPTDESAQPRSGRKPWEQQWDQPAAAASAQATAVPETDGRGGASESFFPRQLQRLGLNLGEGAESGTLGQGVANFRMAGGRDESEVRMLQDALRQMDEQGLDVVPASVRSTAGTPLGLGEFTGMSRAEFEQAIGQTAAEIEAAQAAGAAQRAETLQRREEFPAWHEEDSLLGKLFAGGTALTGQLGGAMVNPENYLPLGVAQRGASLGVNALRTGAGSAGISAAVEPFVQQAEMSRGEREEYSVSDGLLNAGISALASAGIGVSPQVFRSWLGRVAERRNMPAADAARAGFTPDEISDLLRQVEMTAEGQRLTPDEINELIRINTGQDAPARFGEGTGSPEDAARRQADERSLGAMFDSPDVLRREDVNIGPDGIELREGARPLQDLTGAQANPDSYGALAAVERVMREEGLSLSDTRVQAAAREIMENPSADPTAIVRSYGDETLGRGFDQADVQRRRGEEYQRTREGRIADFEAQPEQVQERVRREYAARGIDPDSVQTTFDRAARSGDMREVPDLRAEQADRSRREFSRPAFEVADRRRGRFDEREGRPASDYRAGAVPREEIPQREVYLLGPRRNRDGQLIGGEAVEVLDRRTTPNGAEEVQILRGTDDAEPTWVPAERVERVGTPENARRAQQAAEEQRPPPRGVGQDPELAPSPRAAADRIGEGGDARPGPADEPPAATPRTEAEWEAAWREEGVAEPTQDIPDTTIDIQGRRPEPEPDAPPAATAAEPAAEPPRAPAEQARAPRREPEPEAAPAPERETTGSDLDEFASTLPPQQQGRGREALERPATRGSNETRAELIRRRVDEGFRVETPESGPRRLVHEDGRTVSERAVTRTGMEYAEWLTAQRAARASEEPTPAARQQEAPDAEAARAVREAEESAAQRDTARGETEARQRAEDLRREAVRLVDEQLRIHRDGRSTGQTHVDIQVPGGPRYRVRNTPERLAALRRELEKRTSPEAWQTREPASTGEGFSTSRDAGAANFMLDPDLTPREADLNALSYAEGMGMETVFDNRGQLFVGSRVPADRMGGVEGLVAGQTRADGPDGPVARWQIMHPGSGLAVAPRSGGEGYPSRQAAIKAAREQIERMGPEQVRERMRTMDNPEFQAQQRREFEEGADADTRTQAERSTDRAVDEEAARRRAEDRNRRMGEMSEPDSTTARQTEAEPAPARAADEAEPAPARAAGEAEPAPRQEAEPADAARLNQLADEVAAARTGSQLLDAIDPFVPAAFRPLLQALRASPIVRDVPVRQNNRMRNAEGQHNIRLSGRRSDGPGVYRSIASQSVEVNANHIRAMARGEDVSRLSGPPEQNVAQIMLHELTHAATVRAMSLRTPKTGGKVGEGISVRAERWSQWEPSEKIEAIRRSIIAHLARDSSLDDTTRANLRSATTDIREVVAWGMTNPEVQAVLQRLPALSKRGSSRFRDFVDAVRQALGLTTKHRSALTDLVETTARIISESDAGSTRILNPMEGRAGRGGGDDQSTTVSSAITAKEMAARRAAQQEGALRSGDTAANREAMDTAVQRATGMGSTEAKRWVRQNERLVRALREARERRISSGGAPKQFWQQGSKTSQFAEVTFGSLDGEMRSLAARHDSRALDALADVFHARAGRADGVRRTFSERESQHLNTRARDIQRIQDFMDDADIHTRQDMADIIEMVENPNRARTGSKGEVANRIEKWFADELDYQRKAGVEIGEVDDYFARHTDPGLISGGRGSKAKEDRFVAQATKAYQEMGLPETDARASAQDLLNRVLGNDLDAKPGASHLSGGAPAQNVKGRKFTAAAARHLDEFRDKDIHRVMSRYLMGSTKRAEIARSTMQLPDGTELAFGDRFSNMSEIIRALEADGVPAAEINNVRDMIAVNTGVQGSRRSAGLMKFSTTVRTLGALSFMDRSALSSVPELMTGALRTTTGNPVRDLGSVAASFVQDFDSALRKSFTKITGVDVRNQKMVQARELAEDLGVIAGDSIAYLMSARFIGDDASGPFLQRVQTGFFRNTGLTALNDYTRVKAVRAGDTFVRRLAKDVMSDSARKNNSGSYFLREMGVRKGEERGFADWYVRNFDEEMPSAAELMRMGGKDAEYAEMYRTGIQRIADQSTMRPDATTKPRWASHPVGAMVFHLQSFTWAFTQNVIKRWGRMATDSELPALDRLMMLPGFMAAGGAMFGLSYAANEVRDQLTDLSSSRERTPRTEGAAAERAFSYTGFTGKLDPLIQTFSGTRYQRSVSQTAMGPSGGLLVGSLDATLRAIFANSENTNTAERNLAAAMHQLFITPGIQAGLALGPGFGIPGLAVSGAAITGVRATRDPFIDATAGEEDPQTARRRMSNPQTSLFEQVTGAETPVQGGARRPPSTGGGLSGGGLSGGGLSGGGLSGGGLGGSLTD